MLNDTRGGSGRHDVSQTAGRFAGKLRSVPTLTALITVGLTCLGAVAQADITVLKQHNYVFAKVWGGTYQSGYSATNDLLTSYSKTVGAQVSHYWSHTSGSASVASTIATDSLTLLGQTGTFRTLPFYSASGYSITSIQFQVSTTRVYNLSGMLLSGWDVPNGSVSLLRDGAVWLSGSFVGAYEFEAGHTYEIDAVVQTSTSDSGNVQDFDRYAFWMNSAPLSVSAFTDRGITSVVGGNPFFATVDLNEFAPTTLQVPLKSSNPNVATVPSSATVNIGSSASLEFYINTSAVKVNTLVTFTATYGGVSKTLTIMVTP